MVLAALIAVVCSLLGSFLILRRQALAADAISHSVLPGIVLAYLLMGTLHPLVILSGAAAAGLLCVLLIEWLQGRSRLKADAATGVAFTSLFALGMLLLGLFREKTGRAHLDMDGVLYGHLEVAVLGEWVSTPIGPVTLPVANMFGILVLVVGLITVFFRQWLVTSFHAEFATTIGLRSKLWHALLMSLTGMVVVAALESVGAVLVVGMMTLPAATARLFARRLVSQLLASVAFALLATVAGVHLAMWLNTAIAPCMAVAGGLTFFACWIGSLLAGLVSKL